MPCSTPVDLQIVDASGTQFPSRRHRDNKLGTGIGVSHDTVKMRAWPTGGPLLNPLARQFRFSSDRLFLDFQKLKCAGHGFWPGIRNLIRGRHRIVLFRADGKDVMGLRIQRDGTGAVDRFDVRD